MNDIEILEEYIKELNKNKKKHELVYSTGFGKYWSDFSKAIENLIQRNKDLEQIEKEHKEENGRLRNIIKKLEMEKEKNNKIYDFCRRELAFERRLKKEKRKPDEFNQGRFYVCENIKEILTNKVEKSEK